MKIFERIPAKERIILVVVAIAIAVRLFSFGYLESLAAKNPSALPYPIVPGDSASYAHLAENLLTLHAYDVPGAPNLEWPPGYPALLAFFKLVTGSVTWVVMLQLLISICAISLIYAMARTLMPPYFAALPALAYALDPMVIFSDTTVLTDGLFSALLVCIVYFAFFQTRMRGAVQWGIVGVLLGVVTFIRPIAEFLVLVFTAMYLISIWLSGKRIDRAWWKSAGACVLGCALVITPWVVRNELFFGTPEISNLGGVNLLQNDVRPFLTWRAEGGASPKSALLAGRQIDNPAYRAVTDKLNAELTALTPPGGDPSSYMSKLAFHHILLDPVRFAYFDAVNTMPFIVSSSIMSYGQVVSQLRDNQGFSAPASLSVMSMGVRILHPTGFSSFLGALWSLAPVAIEILLWVLAAALAIFGLVRRRRESAVIICAILFAYFAAITGPESNSRYRIPAEPYLFILAAAGVYAASTRLQSGKKIEV